MTIARREDCGCEAAIGQLIENERQEWAAVYRRHGFGKTVHNPTQTRSEAAREDDRFH